MRVYHYEYAVYTNNLNWGRTYLGSGRTYQEANQIGIDAHKGVFVIERVRVYDKRETTESF